MASDFNTDKNKASQRYYSRDMQNRKQPENTFFVGGGGMVTLCYVGKFT